MSTSSSLTFTVCPDINSFFMLTNIISAFEARHWSLENEEGKMTYLPIGDDDCYGWSSCAISRDIFASIIYKKFLADEIIGFEFTQKPNYVGGEILIFQDRKISLNLSINRKITKQGFTDINWYLNEIYLSLYSIGYSVGSISFDEYL